VGYIAKRIDMRKKRYQNLQKLAEQRRAAMAINAGGAEGDQTASTVAKNVSFFFLLLLHLRLRAGRHLVGEMFNKLCMQYKLK
jgi:hypothetical protein